MKGAPLTVTEARVILRADEALDLTFEARVAAGTLFSDEEGEAWIALVASANERIAAWEAHDQAAPRTGYTIKRLTDADVAELAELLRVYVDDTLADYAHLKAWRQRLREIREKMIERLGDVA